MKERKKCAFGWVAIWEISVKELKDITWLSEYIV